MTHRVIRAESLFIGDRQREDFNPEAIDELCASIERVGLIHAPVVKPVDGDRFQLIVGERRIRALALTKGYKYGKAEYTFPEIPVHVVYEEDPRVLFEIELEENIRRVNLSAMEKAQAIAKLHSVRLEANPQHTRKDTAEEVAKLEDKEVSSNDLVIVADSILVDSFKDDEEVQKAAKTGGLAKAAKVAKKKLELLFNSALSDDVQTDTAFTVIHGNAFDILPTLPPASFDILLFDPPYGVGADTFGEQAEALGHQYKDDENTATEFLVNVISRTPYLKPECHVLMFCSPDLFNSWKDLYEYYYFDVWPRPLIWDKGTGHLPVPDRGPRYTYETILFASRGRRKISQVIHDVLRYPAVRDKLHAAEKPAALFAALLDFVGRPGDRVLDPCCGSGPIFTGARGKEISVVGIEQVKEYADLAKTRAGC